jgi:tubulin polyglutamylase TTLL4
MNNRSYSILTKQIFNNSKHTKNLPENVFCSVCNVYMNRIERSQLFDTHQEHNVFLSDRTKECWHSIDCLQTLHNNLHQTVDHTYCSSERQLKLNPYLMLDTDPTLDNLKNSNALSRYSHSLGK